MTTLLRLALLSFLFALVSGCVGSDSASPDDAIERVGLTEAVHAIGSHLDASFVGATGTQLYVDYVLPNPIPEGGAPVILVFTPYQSPDVAVPEGGEGGAPPQDDPYEPGLVEYFVPRGYVLAFADVRGNHNAGGCIDQTGPQQWQDGYDYVEWLGTQPWSNGKVGMHGASYDAETQFTTAMMQPPHLATIIPVASVSNQYEWSFYQGVPYEMQPLLGMASYFQGSAVPSTDPANAALYPEKLSCQQQQFEAGLDFSGDMTTFWQERDYRPMAKQIQVPVLHIHGLADWNVRPIHIDPLFNDIQSEKRAIYGQWGHAYPNRPDWAWIRHAWYDHFLFGRENGILEILPPVLIEDNQGDWHRLDAFPPIPDEVLELELSADGTLAAPGTAEPGTLTLADYPEEAVVAGLGSNAVGDDEALPTDPDRLEWSFRTDRDLRVVGRPSLTFTATTDTTSTHWVAHLNVEGAECLLTSTICENAGYQDTRHRDGFDDPKDLESGVPYVLNLTMYPQDDVIPAGSTVRLVLSNNDDEVSQDPTFARSSLDLGDGRAVLRLPLVDSGPELPEDLLPGIPPEAMEL